MEPDHSSLTEFPPQEPATVQKKHGEITGKMTYREGDGIAIEIPPGPVELAIADIDVTITWRDEDIRGSAAIPMAEYFHYVKKGILTVH